MNQLTILPRKTTENNREYSYRILRYNIMTLVLEPGATLNENEIAEQINVSRTPVHEALTKLKSEYLVDIVPQSGSSVSLISLRNIREGLFMRTTIEPVIYRQLAGTIEGKYLTQMEENLAEADRMILSIEDDSIDRYIKLDDQFHKIAYVAAQKTILWAAMKQVCSHFQRIRYQESILIKKDLTHISGEHKKLYEYLLLGGDSFFNLETFYHEHLSYFKGYFAQILSEYPDYFIKD